MQKETNNILKVDFGDFNKNNDATFSMAPDWKILEFNSNRVIGIPISNTSPYETYEKAAVMRGEVDPFFTRTKSNVIVLGQPLQK